MSQDWVLLNWEVIYVVSYQSQTKEGYSFSEKIIGKGKRKQLLSKGKLLHCSSVNQHLCIDSPVTEMGTHHQRPA
jgi:hypothetical protein